ncbi:MAG: asparaginase [Candidatus Eisenbacteria bacterium]|nr:asparaginase [Candidatus Eisenbacteria bacterium]
MNHQAYAPMVEVTRGVSIESAHRGAIAAVDMNGRLIASIGTPAHPVFVRSCAKPFQALALVCSGAADAFGVTEEELAVVCASHSGEPEHVRLVTSLLQKAGISLDHLKCGAHPPFDSNARRALAAQGAAPSVLHNNCSGKHAGMLVTAQHLGLPLDDYTDPEHAVQVAIRVLLGFLSGLEPEEITVAVDCCTAPTYCLPLRSFALAFARLAAVGEGIAIQPAGEGWDGEEDAPVEFDLEAESAFPVSIRDGLTRVWRAMRDHPVLIAGTRGRLCTDLMLHARGLGLPLVAKSGAEGAYAMAVVQDGRAYGITLKVEDGAQRARDAAAIDTLLQLELLPESSSEALAGYHRQPVLDHRDRTVGEVRARFRLSHGLPG